ncbi:MAG TPA: serine/threonine-protein kinase [Anaeromyxobacteraceae bacterium]|nr:serine/threonine-protein kinase [Anaeromyxobacteraceae bacterium]
MPVCEKCHREAVTGALFCVFCGANFAPAAADSSAPDRFVGQTLKGMYLIQQRIADGGMGQVYKALHIALDAPFAVKIVKQGLLSDPGVVGRFQREARAVSKLRHPNVVAVTDFGQTDDGTLFMVMEYVSGRSLARVIAEESPLREHRVVHIGAQILSAFAEAHANQLLHRDLKPENVMIESRRDAADFVKVLDFGIAKLQIAGAPASTLTRAGLVCGTPGYMSPEQLTGGDLDARSDLYAVGVVLYEMLTGRLPFDPATPVQLAQKQMTEVPKAPSALRPGPVSADLEALVLRALSPQREDRPQSAVAMREELLRCSVQPPPLSDDPAECGPTIVLPRRSPPIGRPRETPGRPVVPDSQSTLQRMTPRGTPEASRPTPTTAIIPDVLKTIERRAVAFLGPVAPFLVKKAGATAASAEELCEIVATFIPSEDDRTEFLKGFGAARATPAPVEPRPPTAVVWEPALLDRARKALAAHIGPVARVVVKRASAVARSPEDLYALLAREIPNEPDRAAFLHSLESADSAP